MTGTAAVILLCALACPIAMGVGMYFMGRGMRHQDRRDSGQREPDARDERAA